MGKKHTTLEILKIALYSALVFILSAVILYLILNPFRDTRLAFSFYSMFIVLFPSFIVTALFNRKNTVYDSLIFGALVGFFGGTLYLIYWFFFILQHDGWGDYSLLPVIWIILTVIFVFYGCIGSLVSYFIRKTLQKS